jgi:hypothetical protein
MLPIALNKTSRYCADCDPLLVHQDDLEHLLAQMFSDIDPSVTGNGRLS